MSQQQQQQQAHETDHNGWTFGSIVRIIVVLVPVAAAIPTVFDLYTAITEDVPFWEVRSIIRQGKLAQRNWDCQPQMKYSELADLKIPNDHESYIFAGACPKSGDTHVRLQNAETGVPSQLWISYNELNTERAGFNWLDILRGPKKATAAERTSIQFAQASTFQVMCVAWVEKSKIVQIVKEGDKCYREEVSPLGGKVLGRTEVACTEKCPASKYKP